MNNDSMFLNIKHTDTLIEQPTSKPQEKFNVKLNKQMEFFSFNPPINQFEEGKCLLAVKSFETTNFVFNITDEIKSFSIATTNL